jgi:hypothetical protein
MAFRRFAVTASVAFLSLAQFARADVIVTHGGGMIDGPNTIDKYGLFGPAHMNLRGLPFSYQARYESDEFGSSKSCGTNCLFYNSVSGAPHRTVKISITVNGHTLSFNANKSGQVEFYEFDPEEWSYAISADSDFNNSTGTGASLLAWYEEPAIFGKKIKKRCYDWELQDYLVIYRTHHSQSEELSFLLTTKD